MELGQGQVQGQEQEGRITIRYTYPEFLRDVLLIAGQLQRHDEIDDWRPDAVFCLARGGLSMASYLAHRMNVKQVAEVDTFLADEMPKRLVPKTHGKKHHYLLVDDISDSGHTMAIAKAALEAKITAKGWDAEITTATLWIRDTTTLIPNAFARIVYGDAWIDFPWEADLRHSEMGYVIEIMGFNRQLYDPSRYLAILPMKDEDIEAGKVPTVLTTTVPERASIFEDVAELHTIMDELLQDTGSYSSVFSQGTLIQATCAYDRDQHAKYWRTFKI